MFYLKKILSALFLPPAGPILLALWGIWLARRRPRAGPALAVCALAGLLALSLPATGDALLAGLETLPPVAKSDLERAQVIVVLGGGNYHAAPEYGGDTVNRATLERLRYAVRLQRQTGLPILVSGGAPFGGRPEGEAMRAVIVEDFGGKVAWVENAARDTAENAAFSAALLRAAGIGRIALVSHAWHLPRAVERFEREHLAVVAAPTGYTTPAPAESSLWLPSAAALARSSAALHERLGRFAQDF